MPLPLAAALQAGTSILNTGAQIFTNAQNRRNALKDQKALNAYNTPAQQMQRFKEAGLNPNLIYKQTNEGAAVRSTDAIAPKLEEGALEILGKSNNIQVQQLNMESMKLRNQNQELQNEILRDTLNDQKEKYGIQNRVGNATYDNLIAGANLRRQELSQKNTINPLEAERLKKQNNILEEQFKSLSSLNEFNQISRPVQIQIAQATRDNLQRIGTGLDTTNKIKDFEFRMKDTLDNLGIGSGLAQSIIKILISKL
jgi:hypothetical protein